MPDSFPKGVLAAITAVVLSVGLNACSPPAPEVDIADVERIVGTLSADSMRGRRAFTPDIDRAAAFLAAEFSAIGLDPLDGLSGYRQQFSVYSMEPSSSAVTLNGRTVQAERFLISSTERVLDLSLDDFDVVRVGADGDLRAAVGAARGGDGATLLVVDPAHRDLFDRFRQFTSGASRALDLGAAPTVVAVLLAAASLQSVQVKATYDVEELELANVAGQITGRRPDEFVLFSAHYDHIGVRPNAEGDSIANGANDDASGVAAVVELARYFKATGKPERTLLFAAFTAEEVGGYGSRYFSRQLDPDQIVAMFNVEMIGKPAVSGPNTAWITGFDRSNFGEILQHAVEGTEYEFYPDPYPDQNLFFRSDNATLARLGVPAHSISTTPIDVDPDYHQVSDELSTLNLDHLANTIEAIAAGAATIVSGKATPTRVDPEGL